MEVVSCVGIRYRSSCMQAGQGVSDPNPPPPHPLNQAALFGNGLHISTASYTLLESHNTTHFHLCIFYGSRTLMFASQALGGGAEACVEDWGLMKSSTTAACCVCLPFRPAARTSEMEGGKVGATLHDWNRSRRLLWLHSFRFYITENLWGNTETINSACESNMQLSCNHGNIWTISMNTNN